MTASSEPAVSLSATEDGICAAPRELPMPKKRHVETHRFTTPSGVHVSIKRRGNRGWFIDHLLPWSKVRLRELVSKGSRDDAARRATARIEELYRIHAVGTTPTLLSVAAELVVAKRKEGRSEDYIRKVEEHLRCYVGPALGLDTEIGAITSKELLAFKHSLGATDLEPETCNRILTTVRQILKYAEDPAGYITAPALPRNFRSAQWQTRERWQILSPSEIAEMLRVAPEDVRPVLGYIANTGLRVGTALLTETSWIDWDLKRVRYPASAMKGRHPHVVELGPASEMFLKQAVAASPDIPFPYSYWFLLKRWMAIREQLGRPRLRIHDLRHSFVSNQLAAGTPVHVVKDLAAHRSLAVTSLYSHSSDEARVAAAQRVQIGLPEDQETRSAATRTREAAAPVSPRKRASHLRVVR